MVTSHNISSLLSILITLPDLHGETGVANSDTGEHIFYEQWTILTSTQMLPVAFI